MATRKKPKFDKATRVRAVARKRIGSPKPARIFEEKPLRAKPKHKRDWTAAEAGEA